MHRKLSDLRRLAGPSLLLTAVILGCTGDTTTPSPSDADVMGISAARGGVPGAPTTAVMRFGNNSVGTDRFGPEHPSSHARDNLIPTTVVIRAGGSVTFQVQAPHKVAIYEPGTTPEDIRLIPGVTLFDHAGPPGPPFIPNFYIDEPNGRIFLDPVPAFGPPHDVSYTFTEPGRYLVICAITPHFTAFKMYGWVEVK
jgi:plastocyanin